jgi:hypothetical protein
MYQVYLLLLLYDGISLAFLFLFSFLSERHTIFRRTFEMLGFDDVDWAVKGHDDGLQVLRYNKTTAYTSHMDYMTDRSGQELFVSCRYCFKGRLL